MGWYLIWVNGKKPSYAHCFIPSLFSTTASHKSWSTFAQEMSCEIYGMIPRNLAQAPSLNRHLLTSGKSVQFPGIPPPHTATYTLHRSSPNLIRYWEAQGLLWEGGVERLSLIYICFTCLCLDPIHYCKFLTQHWEHCTVSLLNAAQNSLT